MVKPPTPKFEVGLFEEEGYVGIRYNSVFSEMMKSIGKFEYENITVVYTNEEVEYHPDFETFTLPHGCFGQGENIKYIFSISDRYSDEKVFALYFVKLEECKNNIIKAIEKLYKEGN